MKKENIVGFKIQGIKTEQFAIFEDNYSPKKETELSTELQFKLDQKNKQIAVFPEFEYKQGKKIFLKIQISCHFSIEEESWAQFIQEENGMLVIPKGFLAHLAMISTGTARGVLFAKTESSAFSKFIIPTLNLTEMIMEDVSVDLLAE